MAAANGVLIGDPLGVRMTANASFTNFAVDANNEKIAWVFSAPDDITVTQLGFRYGVRTGTPPTYRIAIETVNTANNQPSGSTVGGVSRTTFTPPADATWNSTFQWIDLTTNTFSITRGVLYAIVIDYSAGTIDASNNSSFSSSMDAFDIRPAVPYVMQAPGGTYAAFTAGQPVWGFKSASKTYGLPIAAITQTQYSSDSTPDEYAIRFVLPAGWGSTYKVAGVRFIGRTPAASKTIKMALYSGTTELQNVTFDGDQVSASGSGQRFYEMYFDETSLTALDFGTEYRIGFAPQETATNFALTTIDAQNAADLDALPNSTDMYLSTRTNSGAWSDSTSKRVVASLILDDITEPAGGGGGGGGGRGMVVFH